MIVASVEHAYNTNNCGRVEAGISRETYSLSEVSVDRKLNTIYNAYFKYTLLHKFEF